MKRNIRRPAGKGRAGSGKGFLLGVAAGILLLLCAVSVISVLCLKVWGVVRVLWRIVRDRR